jgi:NADH dehydrogenase
VTRDAVQRKPRVVVLGGGFGGIGAARKLHDADVDVVLVDKQDYHTFQPMLYQVATGVVDVSAIADPLRGLFHDQPNARVHQGTADEIDPDSRVVKFTDREPLEYDYLVLALGAEVEFFGVEGAGLHGYPLYTLRDAVRLKEHVVSRWEEADRNPSLIADGALNVVIVGGGATGVESAGALGELYRNVFSEDFPDIDQEHARLILVEAGHALLPMFKKDIQGYTERALGERGVEIMLGEIVESVTPTRVTLKSGTVLKAHTLVWGAGLHAHPIAESLGVKLQHGSRIPVELDLRLADRPEVFAVGDIAWITDAETDEVLPQLGSVALQAGEHAGENVARLVKGKNAKPFEYTDKGTMATIGRGAAVLQTRRGLTMKGRTAFLAWGAVHLALLSTGEERTKAVVDWTWAGLTHERSGRIVVSGSEPTPARR